MRKPGDPQAPPQPQTPPLAQAPPLQHAPPSQHAEPNMVGPNPTVRRPRRQMPKPLDLPPIVGQVAVLLGFLLALYAIVAPKMSAAGGKGARVAEREYSDYIQRQVVKFALQVRDEQELADKALEKDGKKKKTFADKDRERRKRVRVFEKQLEADFDLGAKRRAVANAAGSGSAKSWMLSIGFVGLVLFSLGSLMLMWQSPPGVSKLSYLIMLVIGLLVGGVGLNSPSAGVPVASKIRKTKRNTAPVVLREKIPLPSSHATLSWGMSLAKVQAKVKLGTKTVRDGLDNYAGADSRTSYGFRNGKLVNVALNGWNKQELDDAFVGVGQKCTTSSMTITAGRIGDTAAVRFNTVAMFFLGRDPGATKMMEQMRAACAALRKSLEKK